MLKFPDIKCFECDTLGVDGNSIPNTLCDSCLEKFKSAKIQWEYWSRYDA